MLRQASHAVRDAQRVVLESEALLRRVHRILGQPQPTVPQPRRAHGPDCRHCQLVEGYRLARDTELRHAESLACGDEDYRPVTFRQWLEQSGQERRTIRDDEWAAEWS